MTEREKVQIDMKLEVVVLGVSDVDRAKAFYEKLGWRLDAGRARAADRSSRGGTGCSSAACRFTW